MPEISIIVPVYNVEEHVNKCIDSILSQTFGDFELILIDDGSTDKSGKICDSYAKRDSRIKVVHQKNGGLSAARNAGIDMALGEFLGFIDSDDFIEKDMYSTLYEDINGSGADIAVCGLYDVYGKKCIKNKYTMNKCVLDSKMAFKLVLESKFISVSAVNKLYRKSLFKDLRYPVGKTYEDAFLTPILFLEAQKISYNPAPKYYYNHKTESITTKKFNMSDMSIINAYKHHLDFVEKDMPELKNQAMFRYLWAHMVVMDKLVKCDINNYKCTYERVFKVIKSNIFFVLKSPFFSFRRKISTLIMIFAPRTYKRILKRQEIKNFSKG